MALAYIATGIIYILATAKIDSYFDALFIK